jgi:Major intrinsic protein
LGVGGYIALAGLGAARVSGTSMNPARSFGPTLDSGNRSAYRVYVASPLIGAAIAVGRANILRSRGRDQISHAAGSDVLTARTPGGEGQALAGDRCRAGRTARASTDQHKPRPVIGHDPGFMRVIADETRASLTTRSSTAPRRPLLRAADRFAGLSLLHPRKRERVVGQLGRSDDSCFGSAAS